MTQVTGQPQFSRTTGRDGARDREARPPKDAQVEEIVPSKGLYRRAWEKFRHDPVSVAAACGLSLIVLITLLGPVFADQVLHTTPETIMRLPDQRVAILQPPDSRFLLGTDDLGRDVLTRLLYAGRVSLSIGFMVAFISIVVGTAAGLAAGYWGGWVDDVINAVIQFVFNIPGLFVLIILSVMFRPGVVALAIIFGFFFWPGTARQVRGVAQSVRNLDYVVAAQSLGASSVRVMVRHILPNVANIIMVVAGFDVAGAILGESALSYLGFGVQVPLSSWGNMLSGSIDMFHKAPWLVYPPGAMIFVTVLCVVLLADGLRDALDPRV
ncbi:MAG TPA: ABC transporter permease [Chloroflexota bacterium]|nr:ABC transporter permease [Chloroflexota bacterium]